MCLRLSANERIASRLVETPESVTVAIFAFGLTTYDISVSDTKLVFACNTGFIKLPTIGEEKSC